MLSVDIFLTSYTKGSSFVGSILLWQEKTTDFSASLIHWSIGSNDPNTELHKEGKRQLCQFVQGYDSSNYSLFSFSLAPEATFHILKWIFICYCLTRVYMLAPSYPCVTMRFPQGFVSLFILVPGDVFVIGTQLYIILFKTWVNQCY